MSNAPKTSQTHEASLAFWQQHARAQAAFTFTTTLVINLAKGQAGYEYTEWTQPFPVQRRVLWLRK
jgi:hypothetical protein